MLSRHIGEVSRDVVTPCGRAVTPCRRLSRHVVTPCGRVVTPCRHAMSSRHVVTPCCHAKWASCSRHVSKLSFATIDCLLSDFSIHLSILALYHIDLAAILLCCCSSSVQCCWITWKRASTELAIGCMCTR